MFNGAKGQAVRPVKRSDPSDNSVTILTSGCHFRGKLYCKGSTRIGGILEGEIVSEGVLIIEQHATIKAQIIAEEVIIYGAVEGKLEAQVRLELCQTARFKGDLLTPCLAIREGALFSGRALMEMEDQPGIIDDIEAFHAATLTHDIAGIPESASPDIAVM